MFVIITLLITITSDVLIRYFILSSFLICNFQGTCRPVSTNFPPVSGDNEIRTRDLLLARQALSQLSYTPRYFTILLTFCLTMGLNGLEPSTSRLSGVRSNQLSYKPIQIWQPPTLPYRLQYSTIGRSGLNLRVRDVYGCDPWPHRHQKHWALGEFLFEKPSPNTVVLFSWQLNSKTIPTSSFP